MGGMFSLAVLYLFLSLSLSVISVSVWTHLSLSRPSRSLLSLTERIFLRNFESDKTKQAWLQREKKLNKLEQKHNQRLGVSAGACFSPFYPHFSFCFVSHAFVTD